LAVVIGSLAIAGLYAVLRRTPRTWWIWATVFIMVLQMLGAMVFPVFIAPLFNSYTRLEDPAVRDPILRLARANGIHATEVWQVDASRQTTRISANVSGMFGTGRITLNDNLLNRCSPACIEAVMGHHPSGKTRILTSTRWKAEQAPDRTRGVAPATVRPPPR
jgi:STE24 endopeptidase